ncbi:hypothetical protein AB4262_04440 [Vibrio breoganii]|uniref:hypothetical protein n=1 Tax=Vibrio breoganii TaxID=553239 RepID=UPI000C8171C9|nr:hypothetical protein [Vibrio breoganii]PML41724.1 hypothetical protein BCT78_17475 [Vibrio breoganii]
MADKDKKYYEKNKDKILEKRKIEYKVKQDRKTYNELLEEFASVKQRRVATELQRLMQLHSIQQDYIILLYRLWERTVENEIPFAEWLALRLEDSE